MEGEFSTPKTRRESEVWQACDDLWAQNAKPGALTGDNIRDQLLRLGYKRGSPNEIYRYRSSWKESRGISEQGEATEGTTSASDPISRAVSMVYDQMRTQTSEAIDKLTEDYETKLKVSLLEHETLKESLATLTAEKEELESELASAQMRGAKLDVELAEEKREQIALQERLKGTKDQLDSVRAEHERLILELKTFHEREIDLWRVQNNELQRSLAEAKRQAKADVEAQGAKFSDELMTLKTELRQVYEEKAIAVAKLAALELNSQADEALQARLEKQHVETKSWQRKLERLIQRAAGRVVPQRAGKRR